MQWLSDIVRDLLHADLCAIAESRDWEGSVNDRLSRLLGEWQTASPSVQAMMNTVDAAAAAAESEARRLSEYHLSNMAKQEPSRPDEGGSYTHVTAALSDYRIARDELTIERVSSAAWAKYGAVGRPYQAQPRKDTTKLDLLKIDLRRAISQAETQPVPKSDALKAAVQKVAAARVADLMPKRLSVKKAALPPAAAHTAAHGSEADRIDSLLAIARKLPLRDQTALLAVLGGALNQSN